MHYGKGGRGNLRKTQGWNQTVGGRADVEFGKTERRTAVKAGLVSKIILDPQRVEMGLDTL